MKKKLQILTLTAIITSLLCLLGYSPEPGVMSTLYTVSGIFFSIGLSLIIAFDLNPIKNPALLRRVRETLARLRNDYIKWFSISTISYLTFTFIEEKEINPSEVLVRIPHMENLSAALNVDIAPVILNLSLSILVISILFFIVNFIETQKSKDWLSDKIRNEQSE